MDKGFLNWFFGRGQNVVEFGLILPFSFLVALVFSGNLYVGAVIVISQIALLLYLRFSENWENARLESQTFSAGSLSKHLAPKLRRILEGPAVLYVTEYSASALLSWRAATWRRFLKEALKHGSTVKYILTKANETDKHSLAKLKRELEKGANGIIEFYFFTRELPENAEERKLWDSLSTFHPIIVEDSRHQRAMWIEGYHPLGNDEWAYHVEFLMPEDVANDKRYDKYKELFDRVIGKYGTGKEVHS